MLSFVWIICITWAGVMGADIQARFEAALRNAKLGKAQVSLCVMDLSTGKVVAAIDADSARLPASNQKLVTTAAALGVLGPDFIFRTELRLLNPTPDAAVLLVKGDGDPALADPKILAAYKLDIEQLLAVWVKAVQDAGVRKVAQLVMDDRVFDRQMVHPTWPAAQLHSWYCAPVAGLNINDNCLDIYAQPTAAGQPAAIRLVPAAPFLSMDNRTVSLTGGKEGLLVTRKPQTNDLMFSGMVRQRSTEPINLTLHDPPIFMGQVLADRLGRAGIPVSSISQPQYTDQLAEGKLLHALQTTMSAVIKRCNMDSQNLFAEALLKRMGYAISHQPGSWENGSAAAAAYLQKAIGNRATEIHLADGSGLSRDNRVSALALVQLLAVMQRDPRLADIYRQSLSMDHSDGGGKRRFREIEAKLKNHLFPKTGYIAQVTTLSGYLAPADPKNKRMFVFSFLCNQVASISSAHALQDQLLLILDQELNEATR